MLNGTTRNHGIITIRSPAIREGTGMSGVMSVVLVVISAVTTDVATANVMLV